MARFVFYPKLLALLDADGVEYQPFKIFVQSMRQRGYSENTIQAYAAHVSRFLRYIEQAFVVSEPQHADDLRELILSYKDYLLHGIEAQGVPGKIATLNNKKQKTTPSSLLSIDAAVSYYIRLGELKQESFRQDKVIGLFQGASAQVSEEVRSNMQNNSMLSSVIGANSAPWERASHNIWRDKRLTQSKRLAPKAFPMEKALQLIEKAPSYRDKSFYALLAAAGCRTHEALQLLLDDIDMDKHRIYLRNPLLCQKALQGLAQHQEKKLFWKGRATEETFLIEPFKSLFFYNMRQYIQNERNNLVLHQYLFQKRVTGEPYFCSDRSSRVKLFKKAAQRAEVSEVEGISPHSLRHMYGTYVLNYLPPRSDGGSPGLPLPLVRVLMGHSNISSTQVYAKHDEQLLHAQVMLANEKMFQKNLKLDDIRRQYLESELKKLEALTLNAATELVQ